MSFETVIGMEVHAQLLTRSKMFCDCAVPPFDARPNTFACPVCLGLPGSLPTVNQRALEMAGLAALALNCQIGAHVKFDRKNYHYPDLPKGYQISQYDLPLARDGWLDVETGGDSRRIRIRRVHLEEDTAKLFHRDGRDEDGPPRSLVDFNRSGVPLIEIVTEPDLRSPAEARAYVEKLRQILRWLEVSSGDMEKGSIRLEPNISIRPAGSEELGTRTEIKNLNSFRTLELFLTKEAKRQREVIESGSQVEQETLGWDEAHEEILVQRTKEFPDDYRYFPEPDLPPLLFSEDWGEGLRSRLPELPSAMQRRFEETLGVSHRQAVTLTQNRAVAKAFENYVDAVRNTEGRDSADRVQLLVVWMEAEVFSRMNERTLRPEGILERYPVAFVAGLIRLLSEGMITRSTASELGETYPMEELEILPLERFVEQRGLEQITDEAALEGIAHEVIRDNPKPVSDYLKGKETALRYLIGQMMKKTRGQADPQLARRLLEEHLREAGSEREAGR